jgi:hypothetical protein
LVDIDEGKGFRIESLTFKGVWPETDEKELSDIFQAYGGGFNVSEMIERLEAANVAMFPGLASAHDLVEVRQNAQKGTVDVWVVRPASR